MINIWRKVAHKSSSQTIDSEITSLLCVVEMISACKSMVNKTLEIGLKIVFLKIFLSGQNESTIPASNKFIGVKRSRGEMAKRTDQLIVKSTPDCLSYVFD